jgi:hypothetical protein
VRFLALFLSVVFAFQMTIFPHAAYADVAYDAASGPKGEAPVNKVGSLLLAGGLAVMAGTAITIATASSSGNVTQLSGNTFKTSMSGNTVRGQAYFDNGPKLQSIDAQSNSDYVELTDGSRVNGPVSNVTSEGLRCGGQEISMGSVASIHSARVYNFTCTTGPNPKMTFTSTAGKAVVVKTTKTSSSSSSSGEHSTATKVIVTGLVLAGIACAIAIPIAVCCGGGGRRRNNDQQNLANALLLQQLSKNNANRRPSQSSSGP